MPVDDWKKILAFGAGLWLLSLFQQKMALWIGGATLLVLLIKNPNVILDPFGKGK